MRIEDVKAHLELLKQELQKTVQGKVMVRQDRSYKGLEAQGILSYRIYFDTPTGNNDEAIKRAIKVSGFYCAQAKYLIIGGTYGYIYIIRNERA